MFLFPQNQLPSDNTSHLLRRSELHCIIPILRLMPMATVASKVFTFTRAVPSSSYSFFNELRPPASKHADSKLCAMSHCPKNTVIHVIQQSIRYLPIPPPLSPPTLPIASRVPAPYHITKRAGQGTEPIAVAASCWPAKPLNSCLSHACDLFRFRPKSAVLTPLSPLEHTINLCQST